MSSTFETRDEYPWTNRRERWPLLNDIFLRFWKCEEYSHGYVLIDLICRIDASVHTEYRIVLDILFNRLWSLDFLRFYIELPRPIVCIIDDFVGISI